MQVRRTLEWSEPELECASGRTVWIHRRSSSLLNAPCWLKCCSLCSKEAPQTKFRPWCAARTICLTLSFWSQPPSRLINPSFRWLNLVLNLLRFLIPLFVSSFVHDFVCAGTFCQKIMLETRLAVWWTFGCKTIESLVSFVEKRTNSPSPYLKAGFLTCRTSSKRSIQTERPSWVSPPKFSPLPPTFPGF